MGEERDHAAELAAGLWRRLRDVILVAERIETFSFGEERVDKGEPLSAAEAQAVATDQVVRAMREAGDPDGWRLLAAIADGEAGVPLGELADLIDRPRLTTVERINALVQAGLAQRALDLDRAFSTVAGDALVAFVRATAAQLGEEAAAFRSDAQDVREGGPGSGLPLL